MSKKLFVGSLAYETTNAELEELFSQVGSIESVNVITDRYSGQGKGFAFVEMSTEEEAKKAIATLNGAQFKGRGLVVSVARPQEERGGGRGGPSNYRKGSFQKPKRW